MDASLLRGALGHSIAAAHLLSLVCSAAPVPPDAPAAPRPLPVPIAAEPVWQPLWPGEAPGPAPAGPSDVVNPRGGLTRIARPEFQFWPAPDDAPSPAPALVIFPGGGYANLAIRHEGTDIARWANQLGFSALLVKYRVSDLDAHGYGSPWPLVDAQRAVATARHHAAKWRLNPGRIGVIGFSAGGHLAAMTATARENHPELGTDTVARTSSRPDFALLIYPVIAMDQPHGHSGSRRRLLGEKASPETLRAHNPALHITATTPPLFLVHANDDPVSPLNSLDIARAAHSAGIPVELHLYHSGGHGYGIQQRDKPSDAWPQAAATWLKSR